MGGLVACACVCVCVCDPNLPTYRSTLPVTMGYTR